MSSNQWLLEEEASRHLGVSSGTLQHWREIGYLKPGTHWRSSNEPNQLPWKPKAFYFIRGCKEVIEYFRNKDVYFDQIEA